MKTAFALLVWLLGCGGFFFLGKSQAPPAPPNNVESKVPAKVQPPSPSSLESPFLEKLLRLQSSYEFQVAFEELSPEFQNSEIHDQLFLLADQWAAFHPEEAVRWLDELQFNDIRNPFLFSALSQWARQAPEEVRIWLEQNYADNNPTRDYLLAAVVRGLSKTDPNQALGLLLEAPPSPERSGSLDFLLSTWSQESLSHAFEKITQLPPSETSLRKRALNRLLSELLRAEIPEARRLTENLTAPGEKEEAVTALTSRWAQEDVEGALQWVSQIESPSTRAKAFATLATQWSRQDPEAVSEWISSKQDDEYDLARRSVAATLIAHEPTTALSQIEKITNRELRDQTFEQLGRIWLSRDPQGFRSTMQTKTPMPSAIRESLLKNFR